MYYLISIAGDALNYTSVPFPIFQSQYSTKVSNVPNSIFFISRVIKVCHFIYLSENKMIKITFIITHVLGALTMKGLASIQLTLDNQTFTRQQKIRRF